MIKTSILLLLIIFGAFGALNAQSFNTDSIKRIAENDAKKFKLNKTDLKSFRKDGKASDSELFKPTASNTNNSSLINNPIYIKEFKEIAYKKTLKRKTIAHYILVGGIAYVVAVAIVTVPIATMH